jgi:hypothetical protein
LVCFATPARSEKNLCDALNKAVQDNPDYSELLKAWKEVVSLKDILQIPRDNPAFNIAA